MDFLHYEFLTLGTFVLTGWKVIGLTGTTAEPVRFRCQTCTTQRRPKQVPPVRTMIFQPVSTNVPRVRNG